MLNPRAEQINVPDGATHVIAHQARLSSPRRRGSSTPRLIRSITGASGILGHPPARVTTTEYGVAISRHKLPEVCISLPSSDSEGAWKTGCLLHPRSRVRFALARMHTSIQVQRGHPGLPCAMALRLTSCSPRRTALLPPSPVRNFRSLQTWRQHRDARTTRLRRTRLARTSVAPSASTASHRAFVTFASAPHPP
jgi:hypothetical protein